MKRTDLDGLGYDALTFRTLLAEALEEIRVAQGRQIQVRWQQGERTVAGLLDAPYWDQVAAEQAAELWRYWAGKAEGTEWARRFAEEELHEAGAELFRRHVWNHNAELMKQLGDALHADDPELAVNLFAHGLRAKEGRARAQQLATTMVRQSVALGQGIEARRNHEVTGKRWVVTSKNPRASHAHMHGQTVAAGGTFSNGAQFPGDLALPAGERVKCQCLLELIRKERDD